MTATVFGATGLIGNTIIELLILDTRFTQIKAAVRKKGLFQHSKVVEVEINYNNLQEYSETLKADIFFSCLGTTIKNAGTQQAQLIVDRDYPIEIARLANQLSVSKIITVSSVGADEKSSNFYLRTKGEMENGVIKQMSERAIFVRPSILVGNRKENRIGEKIGIVLMKLIGPLFFGSLTSYKAISAITIANAMIAACFVSTSQFLYYNDMMKLAE